MKLSQLMIWAPVLSLSFLSGCATNQRTFVEDGDKPPKGYKPASEQQITRVGENSYARFSPDGQKVLFLSRKRSHHSQAQVYEWDATEKRERRVTFHDGHDVTPSYDPQGKYILYASETDEIKERPPFIEKKLAAINGADKKPDKKTAIDIPRPSWTLGPHEIYISLPQGRDIRRLTKSPHYDAEPTLHPKGEKIIFSSVRRGQLDLFSMTREGKKVEPFASSEWHETEPVFSPSGDFIAWVRFAPDGQSSDILVAREDGDNMQVITLKDAIHWSPRWSPDGQDIIFSSNLSDKDNFELYVLSKEGQCLRRLTYNSGDDLLPSFSPDASEILFTSDRSGTYQVYKMPYNPPSVCLK